MIVPIGDINPRKTVPFINYLLIAANIGVFIWQFSQPRPEAVIEVYALYPARWDILTLFTSMFMHAGIAHLFGNMLFLWIAGDNVEDRLGHISYLVFYLAAGIAGQFAHILTSSGDALGIPTVGASGAISGVIGAYLIFFPNSRIKFMVLFFFATFTSPSWLAIGLWVAMQATLVYAQIHGKDSSHIAVFAHAGGFALGIVFAIVHRILGIGKAAKNS